MSFHIPLTKSATLNRLLMYIVVYGSCLIFEGSGLIFFAFREQNRPEPPCNFFPRTEVTYQFFISREQSMQCPVLTITAQFNLRTERNVNGCCMKRFRSKQWRECNIDTMLFRTISYHINVNALGVYTVGINNINMINTMTGSVIWGCEVYTLRSTNP